MSKKKMIVPVQNKIKEFNKLFEILSRTQDRHIVFDDFLDFSLLIMNIETKASDFADLEKRWKTEAEHKCFAEMYCLYADIVGNDGEGFYDGLGDLFMEHLSNKHRGQFFTPIEICDMMARMMLDNPVDGSSVCDPTCGSGRTLLAAAKINRNMFFYGADISLTCCKMSVLNMLLNTMCGEIAWMDSLSMQHWRSWKISKVLLTNGHYLPYYKITGPGETDFIQRLQNTMKEEELKVSKKNQIMLF